MKITVLFFAAAKDAVGTSQIEVSLVENATVRHLRNELYDQFPNLRRYNSSLLFAVDNEYAENSTVIHANQQVACFPPVSGG